MIRCSDQKVVTLYPFGIGTGADPLRIYSHERFAAAQVLNPYYLPVRLVERDPEYYAARIIDLGVLHKGYKERQEYMRGEGVIIHTLLGAGPDLGPVFEASSLPRASELLHDFIELFNIYLTIYKTTKK